MKTLMLLIVLTGLLHAQVLPHTPYFDRVAGLFHKLNEWREHPNKIYNFQQAFYELRTMDYEINEKDGFYICYDTQDEIEKA